MHFADLHDTPGRMKAKGVIRQQVQWADSRRFFYWRLRRQLRVFEATGVMLGDSCKTPGERKKAISALKSFFFCSSGQPEQAWEDDQAVLAWFEAEDAAIKQFVCAKKAETCIADIGAKISEMMMVTSAKSAGGEAGSALKQALMNLPAEERAQILAALQ